MKIQMENFQQLADAESEKGPEIVNYEVDWKGPDDPNKPMNWPKSRKQGIIAAVCAMRFTTYDSIGCSFGEFPDMLGDNQLTLSNSPLASSMMSPALLVIRNDFPEASETLLSFSVSIYVSTSPVSSAVSLTFPDHWLRAGPSTPRATVGGIWPQRNIPCWQCHVHDFHGLLWAITEHRCSTSFSTDGWFLRGSATNKWRRDDCGLGPCRKAWTVSYPGHHYLQSLTFS